MARTRTPTAELELKGSFKRHPERRRARANEPKPSGPLGGPLESLSDSEKLIWEELASIAPPRVLTNADRWLVELACRTMNKVRKDGIGGRYGASVGELAQLTQFLIRMGMTPADRSKVGVPKDGEETNPFADIAEESGRPN